MIQTFFQPHVFAAVCGEDLVILDAAAGDYMCLPGAGLAVWSSPDSNRVTIHNHEVAELLALSRLTDETAGLRTRKRAPAAPTEDLPAFCEQQFSVGHAGLMLLSGVDMVLGYWRRTFADVIGLERESPSGRIDPRAAAREALAFRALLPWAPFQGECLFRSAMLRAFLRRRRLGATWVIGCQTWPFEAHCWLQVENVVLDDTVEHVSGFTPIMAL